MNQTNMSQRLLPSIGLCAIVKNEEENLAGGIQSYLDNIIQHVGLAVVVDTGSTDNTLSILNANASKIPHLHVFESNFETFALTRNRSIDFALSLKESYPHITHLLLLDADERLDRTNLLMLSYTLYHINNFSSKIDPFENTCIKFKAINVNEDGTPSSRKNAGLMNPRVFPFDKGFKFLDMVQEKRFERLMLLGDDDESQDQPSKPVPKSYYFPRSDFLPLQDANVGDFDKCLSTWGSSVGLDTTVHEADPNYATLKMSLCKTDVTFLHYVPPVSQRVQKNKKYQGAELASQLEKTQHKSSMKSSFEKEVSGRMRWAILRHAERVSKLYRLVHPCDNPSTSNIHNVRESLDDLQNFLSKKEYSWNQVYQSQLYHYQLVSCFHVTNDIFTPINAEHFSNVEPALEAGLSKDYHYFLRWQDDLCLTIALRQHKSYFSQREFTPVDICGNRLANEYVQSLVSNCLQQSNLLEINHIQLEQLGSSISSNTIKTINQAETDHNIDWDSKLQLVLWSILKTVCPQIPEIVSLIDAKSFTSVIFQQITQILLHTNHCSEPSDCFKNIFVVSRTAFAIVLLSDPTTLHVFHLHTSTSNTSSDLLLSYVAKFCPLKDFSITGGFLEKTAFTRETLTIFSSLQSFAQDLRNKEPVSADQYAIPKLTSLYEVLYHVPKDLGLPLPKSQLKNCIGQEEYKNKTTQLATNTTKSLDEKSDQTNVLPTFRPQYTISPYLESFLKQSTEVATSELDTCFEILAISRPSDAISSSMLSILTSDGTVWVYDIPV